MKIILTSMMAAATMSIAGVPNLIDTPPEDRRTEREWQQVRPPVPTEKPGPVNIPKQVTIWQSPPVTVANIQLLGDPTDLAAFLSLKDTSGTLIFELLRSASTGKKTARDVRTIAEATTRTIIQKGYLLGWIAPEGPVQNGILTFRVSMGKIGDVTIANADDLNWHTETEIKDRLAVAPNAVFNYDEIRERLSRINYETTATVDMHVQGKSLSDQTRIADLDLTVADRFPVKLRLAANSDRVSGARAGRYEAEVRIYNLTGHYDQLHLGFYAGSELDEYVSWTASYAIPLSADRSWRLRLFGGSGDSDLIDFLPELDFTAHESYYGAEVSKSLAQRGNWLPELSLRVQRTTYRDNINLAGISFLSQDVATTQIRAGLRLQNPQADRFNGRTWLAAFATVQPTGLRNDRSTTQSFFGQQSYAYLNLSGLRLQKLTPWLLLEARGRAQFSGNDVLTQDLYSLGGSHTIRGYALSEVAGDEGYHAQLTLLANLPSEIPGRWQFGPFFDTGSVQSKINLPGATSKQRLRSAGLELRTAFQNRLFIRSHIAWAQEESSETDRDPRAFISGELIF